MILSGVVLACLVVFAVATGWIGRPATPFLAVVSILWLLVNSQVEGTVLLRISPGHGLTSADLAGVAGLLMAGVVAVFRP